MTTIWVILAVIVAAVIGGSTFIAVRRAQEKARRALNERVVATPCASNGHAYRAHETGWRCVECGNHVPRVEGEAYGPAEDGLRERRRESR